MMANPRSWLELDTQALYNNILTYKKIINGRLLAPVIKSNAYGHGLIEIGQLCDQFDAVNFLCVAMLSEAIALRNARVKKPILVLSCIDMPIASAVNQQIEFMIGDLHSAQELQKQALKLKTSFTIHIKIDTGLSRLGFEPTQAISSIKKIREYTNLTIVGLATHFAESQLADLSYTHYQRDLFYQLYQQLQELGITFTYVHASNSAAATAIDLSFCNLFRIGAGMYGIWPSVENELLTKQIHGPCSLSQVLHWKTNIIAIKTIEAAQAVGYNRTFISTSPMKLAILPVGYYDGYDFKLANSGQVVVNGQHAPIVGRISMNLTTIDITHISNASIGTEVMLLGNYPGITVSDLSHAAQNANLRELVTKINAALPRVIMQQDRVLMNTIEQEKMI